MRYVVVGGNSFIGRNLVSTLIEQGLDFVSLDINPDERSVKFDIRSDDINRYLDNEAVVIILAAASNTQQCMANPLSVFSLNIYSLAKILDDCKAVDGVRVIFSSTEWVYDALAGLPDHDDIRHAYARSKLLGEEIISEWSRVTGRIATTLRYGIIYGTRHEGSAVETLANEIFGGFTPVVGNVRTCRRFIHVDDVVTAIVLAANKGLSGTYDVTGSSLVTLEEIGKMAGQICGRGVVSLKQRNEVASVRCTDDYLLAKFPGFKPRIDILEGIRLLYIAHEKSA